MKTLLALLITAVSAQASILECQDALTTALTRDPVKTYETMYAIGQEAAARDADSFEFEQGRTTLTQILTDLRARPTLADLKRRGELLAKSSLHYHSLWRFVLDYVKAIDAIVRAQHPELTSRYNEGLAAHLFEPFLARAPHAILFPSFESVDLEYFLSTKSVPVYLIGIVTEPTHADGYLLSPLEFFMHDLGHSDYMAVRDLKILQNGRIPMGMRIKRWNFVAKRLRQGRDRIRNKDPDLADAIQMLLFEILHERGFSYEPLSLRQETDTEKWPDVVRRKYSSVFFRGAKDLNTRLFDRLTEARLWIAAEIRGLITDEIAPELRRRIRTHQLTTVLHVPRAQYFSGTPQGVQITPGGTFTAFFETASGVVTTDLYYNVSLAQIDAIQNSPLTSEQLKRMEDALAQGLSVHVSPQGTWSTASSESGAKTAQTPRKRLTSLHVFKINQLLGLASRGAQATFSLPSEPVSYSGQVLKVTRYGERRVTLKTAQELVTLPLSEVALQD